MLLAGGHYQNNWMGIKLLKLNTDAWRKDGPVVNTGVKE
jgi:hypothetical protein